MRTIGMIGGLSWESTVTYYQVINTAVKERLGGLHSAKCLLHSVDFHEIAAMQAKGYWDGIAALLGNAAAGLEQAGADFIIICTNTMHYVAEQVEARVSIPLLHIAEATANAVLEKSMRKVGLLGTAFTMEQDFYRKKLEGRGIEVLVPDEDDRREVSRIIYEELCLGKILPESRSQYLEVMNKLAAQGAQGMVLGCTEIGLLVGPADTGLALFDTAQIHAAEAAAYALK